MDIYSVSGEVQRNADKILEAICHQDKLKQELHELNVELSNVSHILNNVHVRYSAYIMYLKTILSQDMLPGINL